MISPPWTDEHIAELRRLSGEGLSGGQIAKAMAKLRPGLTRSGAIGAMHRRGIASLTSLGAASVALKNIRAKPTPKAKLVAAPAKPQRKSGAAMRPLLPKSPAPEPPPPASTWAPLPGTSPKPLLECSAGACRWAVTGAGGETLFGECQLFCCAPQHGDGPYCASHRRLAYAPKPKARRAA